MFIHTNEHLKDFLTTKYNVNKYINRNLNDSLWLIGLIFTDRTIGDLLSITDKRISQLCHVHFFHIRAASWAESSVVCHLASHMKKNNKIQTPWRYLKPKLLRAGDLKSTFDHERPHKHSILTNNYSNDADK